MTARFRSAFFGSSGFVAVRPTARLVEGIGHQDVRAPAGARAITFRPDAADRIKSPDAEASKAWTA